ncbi:MAG: beta-ketoacyl synthase N-terminal-like domain-containing protein [bacterium]
MRSNDTGIVITGLGIVSVLGNNLPSHWSNFLAEESFMGIRDKTKLSGYIGAFDVDEYLSPSTSLRRRLSKTEKLGIAALGQALQDSGLYHSRENISGAALVLGVDQAIEGIKANFYRQVLSGDFNELSPQDFIFTTPNCLGAQLSIIFGFRGPGITFTQGNVASARAIAHAFDLIRFGKASIAAVGGINIISPEVYSVFNNLGLLDSAKEGDKIDPSLSINYPKGMTLSEGAGFLILESLSGARARGAKIYGTVSGISFGFSPVSKAYTSKDKEGIVQAMSAVLCLSDTSVEEVGFICASANFSPLLDRLEIEGLKYLFGKRLFDIPVGFPKFLLGETMAASSVISVINTIQGIVEGRMPFPFILGKMDDKFHPYQSQVKSPGPNCCMVNSIDFFGTCSSMILKILKGQNGLNFEEECMSLSGTTNYKNML